jgi:hypothetical protein
MQSIKKGEQQKMKTLKHRVKPQNAAIQQPEKQEKTQNNAQILRVMTGSPKHGTRWARAQLVPTLERA